MMGLPIPLPMAMQRRALWLVVTIELSSLLSFRVAQATGAAVQIGQIIIGSGAGAGTSGSAPTPGSEPRPTALRRLAWEIDKRTSIDMATEAARIGLADTALFRHPILYLAGDRSFAPPSDAEVARLRHHLAYGGTLIIDDAEGRVGGGFDESARLLVQRLFPQTPLRPVPSEHVIYKSFYLLSGAPGRVEVARELKAVEQDGRLVVIFAQNDLGGAWARNNLGRYEFEVSPGGEAQREMAYRVGVNLLMYALCLDYKDDQVHVPFILKRRQWRVEP